MVATMIVQSKANVGGRSLNIPIKDHSVFRSFALKSNIGSTMLLTNLLLKGQKKNISNKRMLYILSCSSSGILGYWPPWPGAGGGATPWPGNPCINVPGRRGVKLAIAPPPRGAGQEGHLLGEVTEGVGRSHGEWWPMGGVAMAPLKKKKDCIFFIWFFLTLMQYLWPSQ